MKRKMIRGTLLIGALLALSSTITFADERTSGPWKFYNGTKIESEHIQESDCLAKLNGMPALDSDKVYNCEYRHRRLVSAATIPDPTDPPIPPTTGSRCTPNADPSNYLSRLSGSVCLKSGSYTQGMLVPSDVDIVSEFINGADFSGASVTLAATSNTPSQKAVVLLSGSNSSVDGIKVHSPTSATAHACLVGGNNNVMRNSDCSHGGAYKHMTPLRITGSNNLIVDSWFYGKGRYVVQCFMGDGNVIRGNVARWDSTTPNEISEPNATFSIYNCSNTIVENNISLDYGKPETAMKFGGDFYSPSNQEVYPELNHHNKFLGNIVVGHDKTTLNNRAFRADNRSDGSTIPGGVIKDFYVVGSNWDFVIKSNYAFAISDCTLKDVANLSGVNCGDGADISFKYENGVKTNKPLFPFVNEAAIKSSMCDAGERQSSWCNVDASLTNYIMSF